MFVIYYVTNDTEDCAFIREQKGDTCRYIGKRWKDSPSASLLILPTIENFLELSK